MLSEPQCIKPNLTKSRKMFNLSSAVISQCRCSLISVNNQGCSNKLLYQQAKLDNKLTSNHKEVENLVTLRPELLDVESGLQLNETTQMFMRMNLSHLYQGSASNHTCCKLWSRRFKVLVILRVRKNIAIPNKLYVVWTVGDTLVDVVPVCQFTVPLLPSPPVDGHRRCSPRSKVWKQRVRTISTFKEPHSQLQCSQNSKLANHGKTLTQK